ncbi:MAG: DinB family protein [Pirellulales bacterium]
MSELPTFSIETLSEASVIAARDHVSAQIQWARAYTMLLIESVPHELWYQKPAGANSNVAWQVGHLAVAQYGLMLFRQRGRAEGDLDLLPGWLRKGFGKGSVPPSEEERPPQATPAVLLEMLSAIHRQAIQELPSFTAASLMEPTDMPYAAYPIKLGALLFCPIHEGIHAGQIGVLRRLHGLEPLR